MAFGGSFSFFCRRVTFPAPSSLSFLSVREGRLEDSVVQIRQDWRVHSIRRTDSTDAQCSTGVVNGGVA